MTDARAGVTELTYDASHRLESVGEVRETPEGVADAEVEPRARDLKAPRAFRRVW